MPICVILPGIITETLMSKSLARSTLPEPVARFAQAEVAAGHYPSVEDVLISLRTETLPNAEMLTRPP